MAKMGKNLHSNLFILILFEVLLIMLILFYLHSNLFILIPEITGEESAVKIYLHSNLFILILIYYRKIHSYNEIYILIYLY